MWSGASALSRVPEERRLGIAAGLAWVEVADREAFAEVMNDGVHVSTQDNHLAGRHRG